MVDRNRYQVEIIHMYRFVAIVRWALTVGAAAALGTLLASLVLGLMLGLEIDSGIFFPLPYAIVGTAQVSTTYRMLLEQGRRRYLAYLLTIGWGGLLGGAFLAMISAFGDVQLTLVGTLYGTLCAASWSIVDYLVPRPRPSN